MTSHENRQYMNYQGFTRHIVSCLNSNYSSTDDLLTFQSEFACFATALHHYGHRRFSDPVQEAI